VVKAVTLEVDTVAAQKLSLAASLGTLSLVLRKAGEASVEGTRRISVGDLANDAPTSSGDTSRYAKVVITRASKREEYSVPAEGTTNWHEASPR